MTDVSNAALLQAYKDAIEDNEDGIAKLLKTVILELMSDEEPSTVTINNDRLTFEPYKAVTPWCVSTAEAVRTTTYWTEHQPHNQGGHVMSNTESFDSVVNAAMEKVSSNNEIAAIEVAAMLGMLAGAHDREMKELRKTYERERGRYE